MPTPVLFDTDAGSDIDDLYALALILHHPNLELVGVTTVSGDTQSRARLIAKMLRLAGRGDVPVAAGKSAPPPFSILNHGCLVESGDPEEKQSYGDAVEFILNHLSQAEEPVVLIGTGPWSNLAEVVRRADDAQRAMIDSIAVMGGEIHLLMIESNVKRDPEAVEVLLQSKLPLFCATWSVSRQLNFTMQEIHDLWGESESEFHRALYQGTRLWWNVGQRFKTGPVCYDVIPVFWAAGERETISCIRLDEMKVELQGTHTRGMFLSHPWKLMLSEKTNTVSPEYLTFTDSMDAAALKQSYLDLVFQRT